MKKYFNRVKLCLKQDAKWLKWTIPNESYEYREAFVSFLSSSFVLVAMPILFVFRVVWVTLRCLYLPLKHKDKIEQRFCKQEK